MKLFRGILTLSLLLGLLYACNNDNTKEDNNKDVTGNNSTVDETTKNNNNSTNNTETTQPSQNDNEDELTSMKASDVNYAFIDFDLDVEYANDNSYDVEYENV